MAFDSKEKLFIQRMNVHYVMHVRFYALLFVFMQLKILEAFCQIMSDKFRFAVYV